jgi:nicotinate phosphoribosyltransferase
MAAAYFANRVRALATFELFVRDLPKTRNYLIVAGLEQALDYLEELRFTEEDIVYLRRHPSFPHVPEEFFAFLRDFRFTGDVWAIPEGTPLFANEPLVRVTAPIIEAQVVETSLLATINFQTAIASKAARVAAAAAGRDVIEFGSRRAHGTEAAMLAARAAYVGGCDGTSNVEAGLRFGIPTFGTMAHSWVMTFDDEVAAFQNYMRVFPEASTLLVDTYDTLAAVRKVIAAGLRPAAIRLDSGDLNVLSHGVRQLLDAAGLRDTRIFASGDLDEWRVADLVAAGAPIDAFGVGTRLATSFDEPALGGVYKLVELQRDQEVVGRLKTSTGKVTFPGRKQVWRCHDGAGTLTGDVIACANELGPPGAEPLLVHIIRAGQPLLERPRIADIRARSRGLVARLPSAVQGLDTPAPYPVTVSARLAAEQQKLVAACIGR